MFSFLISTDTSSLDLIYYGLLSAAAGLILTVATPIFVLIPLQLHRISLAPPNIPWTGQKSYTFFPKLRSSLVALKFERENIEEGWEKVYFTTDTPMAETLTQLPQYSSKGKPFVRPSLHWPSVVLPPSDAEWLAHQPESSVAAAKAQDEILALEWLASGPSNAFIHDFTVIRRDLTRQLNACVPEVLDEIHHAFDLHFSKGEDADDGWKDVLVVDAVRRAVCSTANRIIVGLPVCRSEEYFRAVSRWTICFGLTGLVFRSFIPGPLQRFIMPVLSLPTWYWRRKIANMYLPEIERRSKIIQTARAKGEPVKDSGDRKNDLMQWLIEQSFRGNDPAEMESRTIANKLVLFNLFGMASGPFLRTFQPLTNPAPPATHTLTSVLTSLMTTLLTHPQSAETLASLRKEASQILPHAAQTPTLTKQMPFHDSLLRETLRFHPSFDDAMLREIVAPQGLTTPEGVYLPKGSHVAMHTRLMQRSSWSGEGDDWDTFRPFRYCEMVGAERTSYSAGDDATEEERATALLPSEKGQVSAAQISGRYLPFGLGRHAW